MTNGTTTARLNISILSLRMKSTRKVWSSTTTNCSRFSRLPADIWKVGKPPTETARSNDHLTSLAVTGVPSWKVASWRSLKVHDMPSEATCQLSASSGASVRAVVGERAVRQRLRRVGHQPVVAVPGQPVDGLVRADALHVEAVRAEFLHDEQRLGAALRERGRAAERQRGTRRQRRLQEGAAIEGSRVGRHTTLQCELRQAEQAGCQHAGRIRLRPHDVSKPLCLDVNSAKSAASRRRARRLPNR